MLRQGIDDGTTDKIRRYASAVGAPYASTTSASRRLPMISSRFCFLLGIQYPFHGPDYHSLWTNRRGGGRSVLWTGFPARETSSRRRGGFVKGPLMHVEGQKHRLYALSAFRGFLVALRNSDSRSSKETIVEQAEFDGRAVGAD